MDKVNHWEIRPFQPTAADYKAVLTLRNQLWPDNPSTITIWQHWDGLRGPEEPFLRLVVLDNAGRCVAYAQFEATAARHGKFALTVQVHRNWWETPMPAALVERMLAEMRAMGATAVVVSVREDEIARQALLTRFGLRQTMRYPVSQLDVQAFDAARFETAVVRVAASGIEIRQPPPGWQMQPLWQHRVHELDWTLMQDVPHHETRQQTPFEQFVREEFEHPNFLPEGYFFAFDGKQLVGMTNLVMRGGATVRLATAVTGVVGSYRRRGIARALKVKSILWAKSAGTQIIMTDNEEHNPMFLLNQQLGFEPQPAWTDWEKRLN